MRSLVLFAALPLTIDREGWSVIAPGGRVVASGLANVSDAVRAAHVELIVSRSVMLVLRSRRRLVEAMQFARRG